jgi:hypothetical protein
VVRRQVKRLDGSRAKVLLLAAKYLIFQAKLFTRALKQVRGRMGAVVVTVVIPQW